VLGGLDLEDREVCGFFSKLGLVFSTVELIKLKYSLRSLKGYIGIALPPTFAYVSLLLARFAGLVSYVLFSSYAEMVLNTEKRRQFTVVALQLWGAPGPSVVDASAPTTSTLGPSAPAPLDQRQKGLAELAASEDEDTCSGLVFKRKRKDYAAVPAASSSDDCAHPTGSTLTVPLPVMTLWCRRVGGECLWGDRGAPPNDLSVFLQRALSFF